MEPNLTYVHCFLPWCACSIDYFISRLHSRTFQEGPNPLTPLNWPGDPKTTFDPSLTLYIIVLLLVYLSCRLFHIHTPISNIPEWTQPLDPPKLGRDPKTPIDPTLNYFALSYYLVYMLCRSFHIHTTISNLPGGTHPLTLPKWAGTHNRQLIQLWTISHCH